MKERDSLHARQVSQGRERRPKRGANLLKEGKTMVWDLKYGKRNPPFNVFNLIAMSNGEETTIVGPLSLTLAHPTNQREKGALDNSKFVTCLGGSLWVLNLS